MFFRTIDLCAGIGGIRRGFELGGHYKNVLTAEIDEYACQTYEHLFPGCDDPRHNLSDKDFLRLVEKTPYQVLLAGFPCQAFSQAGKQLGFEDETRGTVFFDIKQIIAKTKPRVVFLENVENLLRHDSGNTFNTILKNLEDDLNYQVIGVEGRDENNRFVYRKESFIRNSKDFGVPQNRPRIYIVAFSRDYYGEYLGLVKNELPLRRHEKPIFDSLDALLDDNVDAHYYLSKGYLATLEKHKKRENAKGNGFGYVIVNDPKRKSKISNAVLATGGSGKERNLILQHHQEYDDMLVQGKKSPINSRGVRTMTPEEWGRLQGFVGYGFLNNDGTDRFSFPDGMSRAQQYKQLGNSVTIPVIEEMARFIFEGMNEMRKAMLRDKRAANKLEQQLLREEAQSVSAQTPNEIHRDLDRIPILA